MTTLGEFAPPDRAVVLDVKAGDTVLFAFPADAYTATKQATADYFKRWAELCGVQAIVIFGAMPDVRVLRKTDGK